MSAERNCPRKRKNHRYEKWLEKRETGSKKRSETSLIEYKPLSRRLKISQWHLSKSFSPPKICTERSFLSPRGSAGLATLIIGSGQEVCFCPSRPDPVRNAREQDGTRIGRDGPHLGTWMGPKHCKTKHMANLDGTTSDSGWDLDGPRIGTPNPKAGVGVQR